ncbi:MAG: hypothetical protein GY714_26755 [Desulfobacterales bacterium]|nr:hypothetical protein [Desulfobacterales bacterium]MCP4161951.1 hypothetical protein [Deltaproteobacteria bacterium]
MIQQNGKLAFPIIHRDDMADQGMVFTDNCTNSVAFEIKNYLHLLGARIIMTLIISLIMNR